MGSCSTLSRSLIFGDAFGTGLLSAPSRRDRLVAVLRASIDVDVDDITTYSQDYGQSVLVFFAVPFLLAAIVALICWPTLWIGRCCAHRCWPPHFGHYSTAKQRDALCKYWVCIVLVALPIAFGALAVADGAHDLRHSACAAVDAVDSVGELVGRTATATGALAGTLGVLASEVDGTLSVVATLETRLSGLSVACGAVGHAQASADALARLVPSTQTPPNYDAAVAQLGAAGSAACQTADFVAQAANARQQLAAFDAVLDASAASVTSAASALASANESLGDVQEQLADVAHAALWASPAGLLWDFGGLAIGLPAIALVCLSLLGACCLCNCRHTSKRCGANNCGVQLVGCSWVLASVLAVGYLLLSALLLPTAAAAADLGELARSPAALARAIGPGVCNVMTGAAGEAGASLDACALIAACEAPNGSLADAALSQLGGGSGRLEAADDAYVQAQTAQVRATLTTFETDVESMGNDAARMRAAATEFGAYTPSDFGQGPSDPGYEVVAVELAHVSGNLSIAMDSVAPAVNASEALVGELRVVLGAAEALAASLRALLGGATACGFVPGTWRALVVPLGRAFTVGVGGLGLAAGVLGLALAMWIWPSILLQIRYGEVGHEPGVPRCCHGCFCCCCCGNAAKPRGAKRAIKVDGMSVQPDGESVIGV